MDKTIERYGRKLKDLENSGKPVPECMQSLKDDSLSLVKKIEFLQISKRKLLGQGLESCSIDELQQLENQLERSLSRIRTRKIELMKMQIEKLRQEERALLDENKKLLEKLGMAEMEKSYNKRKTSDRESVQVETVLFIGLPNSR